MPTVEEVTENPKIADVPQAKAIKKQTPPYLATELLQKLTERGVPQLAAFKSRIGLISQGLGKASLDLTIDDIYDVKPRFRDMVKNRKLSENSIQAYVFEITKLLSYAEEMGWSPFADVPQAWRKIFDTAKEKKCLNVCRFAMKLRQLPSQFNQDDLDQWILQRMESRTWGTAIKESRHFTRILRANKAWYPATARQMEDYGVHFEEFPPSLRSEIEKVLNWKTALVAKGRGKNGKIRPVTAKNIRTAFSSVLGFAQKVAGVFPETLADLINEDLMYAYVPWSATERLLCGNTIHLRLVSILALFRQHPDLKHHNMEWLNDLANEVPLESEGQAQAKRAAKQVPYGDVEDIHMEVNKTRKYAAKKGPRKLARVVSIELMMKWLTVLPWRQRNLRDGRIGGPNPNFFKRSLRNTPGVAKSAWVEELLRNNPDAEVWQFRFGPDETKNRRPVHGIIPKQLVPLLEEYLAEHRPHLLGDRSTDTLFVNSKGGKFTSGRINDIVGEQTLRYARKRVTPHTFRHIVAYAWLDKSAKDYLTLSKILWHANVNTTLKIYGSTFNESNGACAMERWLDERGDA